MLVNNLSLSFVVEGVIFIEFQFEFAFKDVSPLLGCWVFDLNVSSEE